MRLGIGVSPFIYYQSDDKVTNLFDMKACGRPTRNNAAITWDADGWPTSLPANVWSGWYLPAIQTYLRPGRYRLTARGTGKFYFAHADLSAAQQVVRVKAATPGAVSTLGEWDLKNTKSTLAGIMETDPADPLRDVKLFRTSQEPSKTFTTEYLDELGKFSTIRLAGWPPVINSQEVNWPSNPDDPSGPVAKWKAGIEFCNAIGRDPWINIPHMASDGYVTELGKLFASSLMPGLTVHIEYSIEVWNTGYPFGYATKWVVEWTKANLGPNYVPQHGHAFLASHVQDVFAAAAPNLKIVRMICDQHFNPETFRQACEMIDAKKLKFDAVCTAPYADPARYIDWAVLDTLVADGTAASRDKAFDAIFAAYDKCMPDLDKYALAYKALADKHGYKIFAYECGPGWQIASPPPAARSALFLDSYRHPKMKAFLSNTYFPWMAKYYDLAMYTQHTDKPLPDKFWGVRGDAGETPCPKLDACLEWCTANNPPPAQPPPPVPATPVGLIASSSSPSTADVTWQAVSGATGYHLQRCTEFTPWSPLATVDGTAGYADSGLTAATAYSYRVAAYNISGVSAFCEPVSVTTLQLPPPPPPPYDPAAEAALLADDIAASIAALASWADRAKRLRDALVK